MYVYMYIRMYICMYVDICITRVYGGGQGRKSSAVMLEAKHEVKYEVKHGRPLTIPMCMQAQMFPGIGRDAVPMSQYMTVYIPPSRPFKGD